MTRTKKIGRNDKCPCGSTKKYKVCCFGKDQHESKHPFSLGHETESEKLLDVRNNLSEKYTDHKVIDVTNLLNEKTYEPIQLCNFQKKIIMVAERTENNDAVFAARERVEKEVDILVLYHGAYTTFNYEKNMNEAIKKAYSMIDERIN